MADNNWVYLPQAQKYINLDYLVSVEYSYEDRWVVEYEDASQMTCRGKDAEMLVEALRKRVNDER